MLGVLVPCRPGQTSPSPMETLEVHTHSKLAKLTLLNSLSFPPFPVSSCAV